MASLSYVVTVHNGISLWTPFSSLPCNFYGKQSNKIHKAKHRWVEFMTYKTGHSPAWKWVRLKGTIIEQTTLGRKEGIFFVRAQQYPFIFARYLGIYSSIFQVDLNTFSLPRTKEIAQIQLFWPVIQVLHF